MLMLRHHSQPSLGDHLGPPPVDLSGHYAFAGQPAFTHSWQLDGLYMMGNADLQHRGWETCILEMRKEKSRDAARSRRGKENYEFYELAKLLPLPAAITSQLDKASIIRLSISYLKLRDFTAHGDPPWSREGPSPNKTIKGGALRSRSLAMDIFEQHQGTHILQSLDGFAFALSADGRFLYISETVSIYLGLSQVEMTGSSIFDYTHQQDHAELAEQLGINLSQNQSMSSPGSVGSDDGSSSSTHGGPSTPTGIDRPVPVMSLGNNSPYKGMERSFCIRMKSTLTKRGCHFKSSGYRVVLVLSHLRPQCTFSHSRKQPPTVMGMVALAIALPPPSINEVRLESDMFVTRLNFDFRIAHCEPRVSELLDYTAEEFTGKNMYNLCHGQDVQKMRKCHIDLINKGQVMSGYYRLINKNGGFTWLQTCATVICNSKNSEEQSIICVNYVISGREYENCILDCSQMPSSGNLKPDDPSNSERGSSPDDDGRDDTSSKDGDPRLSSPKPKEGHSSSCGESNHSDHLTQLNSSKMADPLRSSTVNHNHERLSIHEDSNPSFDLEQKQLDLTTQVSRYQEPSKHVDGVTELHHRVRKRRLVNSSISVESDLKSPKPLSDSTSSLNPSSPMQDSTVHGGDNRMTPDRTGLSSSSDGLCSTTPPAPTEELDGVSRPWKRSPSNNSSLRNSYSESNSGSMSVKDLEDVMNKHLPSSISQDSLSKGQQQRSTIQWIGGPQTSLPASSLLRQLYVNRESVIRSGAHASRSPYYSDVQGTLPTPPGSGSEAYPDQTQFMLPNKMAAESYGVITGYSTTPVTVTSYMDSYSAMTPPASVSPRDKFHPGITDTAAFSEAAAAAAAAAMPHMHHPYVSDGALQHLPLKPQVFVHPGTLDPAAAYGHSHSASQQGLSPEQQQLYAHHASGFHLYHPAAATAGGKATHHTANGASWYPQPNT